MTIPPADRIFRWHGVMASPAEAFTDLTTPTGEFIRQVSAISERYEIVPVRDIVRRRARESLRPRASLTFDDALECQARNAVPILESMNLPYTICIPTESIHTGRPIWNTLLRLCILKTSAAALDLGCISFNLSQADVDRRAIAREIQDLLLCLREPDWRRSVDRVFRQCADVLEESAGHEAIRPMTWAQLQSFQPALCGVASHSRFHKPAVQADAFETLAADAAISRVDIEERLQRPCTTYCFPFGIFTQESMAAATGSGYTTLLTSCPVPVGVMSGGLEGRFEITTIPGTLL